MSSYTYSFNSRCPDCTKAKAVLSNQLTTFQMHLKTEQDKLLELQKKYELLEQQYQIINHELALKEMKEVGIDVAI